MIKKNQLKRQKIIEILYYYNLLYFNLTTQGRKSFIFNKL